MQEVKLNSRVRFPDGGQKQFLEEALLALDTNTSGLAETTHVCDRTIRDWRREKNNIDFYSMFLICDKIGTRLPKNITVLPLYWSTKKASKLGGKRHSELYGSPGTIEGRRRGGLRSQEKFRLDPEYAKRIGVVVRKEIKYPEKSYELAEFIGIMLGDGGISTDYQLTVSFNHKLDLKHAYYIQALIKKLFSLSTTIKIDKSCGSGDIVATGRNLVEFLYRRGIKKGNKVKNQIDVPKWIFDNPQYQSACLRGLFDTDGCIYQHKCTVGNKKYRYIKMCFSNHSMPILFAVEKMLKNLGFNPVVDKKQEAVYLNTASEVKKYFLKIGTSNPRYYNRYITFFSGKIGRIQTQ